MHLHRVRTSAKWFLRNISMFPEPSNFSILRPVTDHNHFSPEGRENWQHNWSERGATNFVAHACGVWVLMCVCFCCAYVYMRMQGYILYAKFYVVIFQHHTSPNHIFESKGRLCRIFKLFFTRLSSIHCVVTPKRVESKQWS